MKIDFGYSELIVNCFNSINKEILDLLNTGFGQCINKY